jgi:hypothetical protein
MTNPPPYPGTPRWVKASGIAAGIVAVLALVLVHTNGGPRHNIPSVGGLDGQAAPEHGR